MEQTKYSLIMTIINRGFTDVVVDAARERGATGGTIVHGKGTGAIAKVFHNIEVAEEKDAILIVTQHQQKNDIMDGIMRAAGLNTQAQGITFSLPVEDFVVLSTANQEQQEQQEQPQPEKQD